MTVDWRHMPPLTALRALEAVARLGGFSAAARALNVTHAAVAQQVRGLETELGVALLRREGRAVVLTAEGARLAAALAEGFGTIQTAVQAAQARREDGPVRITLTAAFAAQWLMPRLRDFWSRHPDIPLSLHPDPRVVDLPREAMDLGIRYGNGSWPGVTVERLAAGRLVVVGAPSLLTDALRDLAALPWVLASDWPEQSNWLASRGFDPGALDVSSFPGEDLAIAAARQGLGLTVEDMALVQDDVAAGRLVILLDDQEKLPAYFVVTPPGPIRPAARIFLAWLLKQT